MLFLLTTLALQASAGEPTALAECTQPANAESLESTLSDVEYAFAKADVDALQRAAAELGDVLPCQQDEVLRPVAARIHRVQGLVAFVNKQPQVATDAFRAARAIEPGYRFPTSVIPEGHPVDGLYQSAEPGEVSTVLVSQPTQGRLQLDGRLVVARPERLPVVAQLFDADGKVWFTADLQPAQPLPTYAGLAPGKLPSGADTSFSLGKGMAIGAGAVGVGAVALFAAGASQAHKLDSADTAYSDLDGIAQRANTLSRVGSGLGLLAVGLGVGATVTW